MHLLRGCGQNGSCAARAATAAAAPAAAGPFAVAGSFQGFPVSPFRAATHARSPHAPALQHDASQGWQLKASNPTGDACAGGGCAQPLDQQMRTPELDMLHEQVCAPSSPGLPSRHSPAAAIAAAVARGVCQTSCRCCEPGEPLPSTHCCPDSVGLHHNLTAWGGGCCLPRAMDGSHSVWDWRWLSPVGLHHSLPATGGGCASEQWWQAGRVQASLKRGQARLCGVGKLQEGAAECCAWAIVTCCCAHRGFCLVGLEGMVPPHLKRTGSQRKRERRGGEEETGAEGLALDGGMIAAPVCHAAAAAAFGHP